MYWTLICIWGLKYFISHAYNAFHVKSYISRMVRHKNTPSPTRRKEKKKNSEAVAIAEIRRYQKSTELLIKKKSFQRLAAEITRDVCNKEELPAFRMKVEAVNVLHESAEAFLVNLFSDATLCTTHAKRVTLRPVDIQLVKKLRGE